MKRGTEAPFDISSLICTWFRCECRSEKVGLCKHCMQFSTEFVNHGVRPQSDALSSKEFTVASTCRDGSFR
jgi:hypothetical protein